jgi:signal transduction histidine kinase
MTLCLLVLLACQAALAAEPKRVLVLHSFNREVKPWKEMSAEIHTELARQSPWPLDIVDHSIVTARNEDDKSEALFVDYLGALFKKEPIDLILSIGAPAAVFVQRHREKLFAATPMVIAALEQRRIQPSLLTENDTVAGVAADFPAIIRNILQVLPDTKTVAVVMGNSPNERYWLEVLRNEYAIFADRVSFIWLNNMSFADILKQAAALPPNSAIFFFLMNVDAAGVSFEGDTAMRRLHAVANAPIFTHDDTYFLARGIVGGPMHSYVNTSRHAVAVAMRVLGGEKPGEIRAPPVRFASPKFDWREIQRWNISEANLPAGAEIHFREPTAWERYRWQLIAIIAALLLQSALIVVLLFERRRRRLAEVDARHRVLEVAHLNRAATAGVMSASIAHELNQPLGAILLNTATLGMLIRADNPDQQEIGDILAEIRRDDERATSIIKGLSGFLKKKSDVEVQVLDLNAVVQGAAQVLKPEAARKDVALRADPASDVLSVRADSVHLQQVILNLAINGMDAMQETAAPRSLVLQAARTGPSEVTVSVSDSGPGIPEDRLTKIFETFYTTKQQGTGLGLSIARTIVELYGGRLWAENRRDGGAMFSFTLPLVARDPDLAETRAS